MTTNSQSRAPQTRCEASAQADLEQAALSAICGALQTYHLPPITVLRLAATAIGVAYARVAEIHDPRNPRGCTCGWTPNARTDIAALQMALAVEAYRTQPYDLRFQPVAGQA